MASLVDFIRESLRIEGILRDPTEAEVTVHESFLCLNEIRVADLENFVNVVAPGAGLRRNVGMDVRVGEHKPPRGGPVIELMLAEFLELVNRQRVTPFKAHCEYEMLHPFMDGNGRSGRMLWAWMMEDPFGLPFLHRFYYQTLESRSS